MKNKKIFITGSSGFVGRHLIEFLIRGHYEFRGATRKDYNDISTFAHWENLLKDCDTVVHLAARVHVMKDDSENPLISFRKVNVEGTVRLAKVAKAMGIQRFIFISSIKVNGEETFDKPFSVHDEPCPLDAYGISKMEAERELMKLHQEGIFDVVIIRPPLVYGKGVKANFKNLFKIVNNKVPLPFGLVRNKRSLVSVLNLCDLIVSCLNHPAAAGRVFLISDGQDYSLKDIINKMGTVLKSKPILLNVPVFVLKFLFQIIGKKKYSDRLLGNLQVDIEDTRNTLGWNPRYSFEKTFEY